jgi:hypothetical protein
MAMAFPVFFSPLFLLICPRQLSSARLVRFGFVHSVLFCSVHLVSFLPLAAPAYPRLSRRISSSSLNSYTATQHLSYVITSYPILFYPTSDQHTRLESLAGMPSRSVFFFCIRGIQTQCNARWYRIGT